MAILCIDIITNILSFFDSDDLITMRYICQTWKNLIDNDDYLWQSMFNRDKIKYNKSWRWNYFLKHNLENGRIIRMAQTAELDVLSIAIIDKYFIMCAVDHSIEIYDMRSDLSIPIYQYMNAHSNYIYHLQYDSKSNLIISHSHDIIKIWRLNKTNIFSLTLLFENMIEIRMFQFYKHGYIANNDENEILLYDYDMENHITTIQTNYVIDTFICYDDWVVVKVGLETDSKSLLYFYKNDFTRWKRMSIFDYYVYPILFINDNCILLKRETYIYEIMDLLTMERKVIVKIDSNYELCYAQFHHNLLVYLWNDKNDNYSLTFCQFDFDTMTVTRSTNVELADRVASFRINDYFLTYNAWSGKLAILDFRPKIDYFKH